jgi:hypothetical protein
MAALRRSFVRICKDWALEIMGLEFMTSLAPTGRISKEKTRISRGFWMGKYEVTQEDYLAVVSSNPSNFTTNHWDGNPIPPDLTRPVECVSWDSSGWVGPTAPFVREALGIYIVRGVPLRGGSSMLSARVIARSLRLLPRDFANRSDSSSGTDD